MKNSIKVVAAYNSLNLPDPICLKYPIARRMSALQKGVGALFESAIEGNQSLWAKFCSDPNSKIFYGTRYGEMQSSLDCAETFFDWHGEKAILSPKAFQNSVANAAMGYLSINKKQSLTSITLTGSSPLFDQALLRAFAFLKNRCSQAIIVTAEESNPVGIDFIWLANIENALEINLTRLSEVQFESNYISENAALAAQKSVKSNVSEDGERALRVTDYQTVMAPSEKNSNVGLGFAGRITSVWSGVNGVFLTFLRAIQI